MTPVFQEGSLPFQHTHEPTPASFTHTYSHHIQQARNLSRILQSSAQPHERAARPLQRPTHHIKVTQPPC